MVHCPPYRLNPVGGQCLAMRSRFLVNRSGSLPTLHKLQWDRGFGECDRVA
ncbi:hypothetical protein [Moorena sp. SIO3I8]|uniref:hypothetical protein n=1 Tax=Moorena sp. SIO3I8 TaxID=2607833 RepID=UPI0013C08A5A|nr:hypothetical protein [Moorena sp. SIO3I8]NEO09441.1 hypothetical protein [Moorena sp. SIO3I8]